MLPSELLHTALFLSLLLERLDAVAESVERGSHVREIGSSVIGSSQTNDL